MPQNTPNRYKQPRRPKPMSDISVPTTTPPSSPQNFPAVGMTLSTYNHDPFAKLKDDSQKSSDRFRRWRLLGSKFSWKRLILVIVIVIVGTGGWLGWKFVYNAHKLFGGSVLGVFSTTKLKGETSGRVNILLAGNSADDPGHDGANLTDSILLLSIDTKDNTAFMLSVPRDLYVAIPGYDHEKINAVYPDGQADHFSEAGYPNGGMGLLEKTIHDDFGITSDYYALINYEALKDAVNDVGGITINIQSSDPRGIYDPDIDYDVHPHVVLAKYTNGLHTLDGEQALDLARARGDAYGSYGFAASDFTRTANQRLMLVALKSKASSVGVLTNPVKVGDLFDAIGSNVQTDFTLSEVHRLFDITKSLNSNSIQSIGLNDANGNNLLMNYEATDGESALAPATGLDDYSAIQAYLEQLTSSNPVVREGANIVVLNATSTDGVAAQQEDVLQAKDLSVSQIADATSMATTTTVIDASSGAKPATEALLKQIYGSASFTTTNPYAGVYKADFIVVVGSDKVNTSSSSN